MESRQHVGALAAPAQEAEDDPPAAAELAGEDGAPAGGAGPAVSPDESPEPGLPVPAKSPEPRPAGARAWTAAMAIVLALLVAAVAVAGVFLARVRGFDAAGSRRQAVVAAARSAVADLTTADYRHPGEYTGRLRSEATGRFLSLFANSATGFTAVLAKGKVQTTGQVAEVGVRHLGTDTAELTVLAYVTVKNSQTPHGTQRIYRLAVWMVPAGSRWLLSNVEFVR